MEALHLNEMASLEGGGGVNKCGAGIAAAAFAGGFYGAAAGAPLGITVVPGFIIGYFGGMAVAYYGNPNC